MTLLAWLRARWAALATLILLASALASGLIGLDYGAHMDEWEHHRHALTSAATGSLLPGGYYVYPSLIHWVSLLGSGIWKVTTGGVITEMPLEEFVLPARAIALVISLAGGWGLYLAGRRLAGSWAGFTAAGIYLTSWHLAFHARWLAPDAMLASVTAFVTWALVSRWQFPTSRRWAIAAAALVGIGTSTKYQGAALIVPVLLTTWLLTSKQERRWRAAFRGGLRDAGVALAAFLLITPGALLEPTHFVRALFWNLDHYENGHEIYFINIQAETIFDPVRYALAVLQYLTTTMASSYLVVSLVIMLLTALGVWTLFARNWRSAVSLTIAPLLLLAYFSTLTVFFPRNFLLILPFLALIAGVGAQVLVTRAPRWMSIALRISIVIAVIALSFDLGRAAIGIPERGPEQQAQLLSARIADNPETCWRLSAQVVASLEEAGFSPKPLANPDTQHELIVFSTGQFRSIRPNTRFASWPGYVPGYFDWLGSREVDYSYYPSWVGESRLLIFNTQKRQEVGLTDDIVADLEISDSCWSL